MSISTASTVPTTLTNPSTPGAPPAATTRKRPASVGGSTSPERALAAVRAEVAARVAARALPPGPLGLAALADVVAELATQPTLWRPIVRHDPQERWYAHLYHAGDLEIWLIGWDVGQDTTLHDHGGSWGAFAVCEGVLTEEHTRHNRHGALQRERQGPGVVRRFDGAYVHNLGNDGAAGPEVATSVHAYSPPLAHMNFFTLDQGRLRPTETVPVGGPDPGVERDPHVVQAGGAV